MPTRTPLDVRGDPARLQQIVWNLLLNAVKFSRTGDTVEVVLRQEHCAGGARGARRRPGHRARVPARAVPPVPPGRRLVHPPACGLGLGPGDREEPGRDARRLVLPRATGPEKAPPSPVRLPLAPQGSAEAKVAGNRRRPRVVARGFLVSHVLDGLVVLVVDDEPDARELLQHSLESAGARTSLAAMRTTRCRRCRTVTVPDIIVSDIGLPDRDGYEFIRRVRRLRGAVATCRRRRSRRWRGAKIAAGR